MFGGFFKILEEYLGTSRKKAVKGLRDDNKTEAKTTILNIKSWDFFFQWFPIAYILLIFDYS